MNNKSYLIAAIILLLSAPAFALGTKGACRAGLETCPEVLNAPGRSRTIKMTVLGKSCRVVRYSRSTSGAKNWRRQREECEKRQREVLGRKSMRKSAILQRNRPRLRASRNNRKSTSYYSRRASSRRYDYYKGPSVGTRIRRTYR